ncbi:MAG: hypothetical protein SVE93_08065 [Candidatus Thermoplasmatota archaeon]|nr:hypothetical protein [Candidatus Thermoplasmatota archaeon]
MMALFVTQQEFMGMVGLTIGYIASFIGMGLAYFSYKRRKK